MKKPNKFIITSLAIFASLTTTITPVFSAYSQSYTEDWEIVDFQSNIEIKNNGDVQINENITVDFSKEAHRGILRSIPYENNAQIKFQNANEPWSVETEKNNGYLDIYLRTPENKYSQKQENFQINYQAEKAIIFHQKKITTNFIGTPTATNGSSQHKPSKQQSNYPQTK